MAEPHDTMKKLIKSFDHKGPELSRFELAAAHQVLADHVGQHPQDTTHAWWLQRVGNRLRFADTGEFRADPPKPAPTRVESLVTGTIGLVLVLLVGGCIAWVWSSGDGKNEPTQGGAIVACESFVEDALTSPGSAEFPSSSSYAVTGGPTTWGVAGHVDSQNGFGALVRTEWVCRVASIDGDSWSLVTLDVS